MEIDYAIESLRAGKAVARKGWNGRGMFLFLVRPHNWGLNSAAFPSTVSNVAGKSRLAPFIAMRTADNMIVPWLASMADQLAGDWYVVEEREGMGNVDIQQQ